MSQDNARKLRRWLPEKRLRESISAENLISVSAALAATVIFIYLGFVAESIEGVIEGVKESTGSTKDGANAKDGTVEIIARIGITLSGIALGFCLSNCWAEWKRGDSRRAKAIEIDNHAEREIRKTVEDHRETSMSLDTLILNKNPGSSEKYRCSSLRKYFLDKRKLDVQRFLDEKALAIRELGYDHKAFLAEKKESLEEILELTDELVNSISELSSSESTKKPTPGDEAAACHCDRVESHETPPSETMEGEAQKEDTESETS